MNTQSIPAHVPASLVRDFNYADMRGETDVWEHFRKEQAAAPDIFYSPYYGGHWVLTRFEDIEYVMSQQKLFSSRHQSVPNNPIRLTMAEYDGDQHMDFRKILMPFLTPTAVAKLGTLAHDLCHSLIDNFYARGECEFISEFAQCMPVAIMMGLLGLPEKDKEYLLELSGDIVRSCDDATQGAAFERMGNYIREKLIPVRLANPGSDIISAIVTAKVQGGRAVTVDEAVGLTTFLIAGGLDAVASTMGFTALFLAEHPEHRRQIIDSPEILNDAVEEIMRRHNVANLARVVVNDMDYKGVRFKAGDMVLTGMSFAGIDPRQYKDPLTVDFKRPNAKGHLLFGRGPHTCVGALLARTEIRVFVREWLKRIPEFQVKKGEKPVMVAGKTNAVRYLPLTWKVA